MEERISPLTSVVAATFFPAPAFGLRERSSELAAALQTEFGDLDFQIAEFVLRLDSQKPVEWWVGCPLLFQRAQLWIGIHHAQITLWHLSDGDEGLVADLWSRLERAVIRGLSGVEALRRELSFHGHFPVPPQRLSPEQVDEDSHPLGRVTFSGRLLHFESAADAQCKVLLDRSTELADALYLGVHARWAPTGPQIPDAVYSFSQLIQGAIAWAEVGADHER